MKRILFVCVENAGRSQMAEAFANYYGKEKLIISSAGNKPADKVNPVVAEAMKEKGIDISMNKPKLLTFQMAQDADLIVTMGCNDQGICPGPFFKPTVDWKLEDPKGKTIIFFLGDWLSVANNYFALELAQLLIHRNHHFIPKFLQLGIQRRACFWNGLAFIRIFVYCSLRLSTVFSFLAAEIFKGRAPFLFVLVLHHFSPV